MNMDLERGFYWWIFLWLYIADSVRANNRTMPYDKHCLSFHTVKGLGGFIPDTIKDSKLLPLSCSYTSWNVTLTIEQVPPPTSSPAGWIPIRVGKENPTARTLVCHSQDFQCLFVFLVAPALHMPELRGWPLQSSVSRLISVCVIVSSPVKSQHACKQLSRLGYFQTQRHSSSQFWY